jgi:hypothetical protein
LAAAPLRCRLPQVCYLCRARGDLLACCGPCFRSFHLACCGSANTAAAATRTTASGAADYHHHRGSGGGSNGGGSGGGDGWLCDECALLQDAVALRREREAEGALAGSGGGGGGHSNGAYHREAPVDRRQRQLHQELAIAPSVYMTPAAGAVDAVRRGLAFIYRLAEDPKNFADFGADIMVSAARQRQL